MAVKIWFTDIESMDAKTIALIQKRFCTVTETQPINYRRPIDRLRHQTGIIMAAELLGYPEIPPLTVVRGKYGKPYFEEFPGFHFNISHSGKYIVCAADEQPVGADIQESIELPQKSWHLFMTHHETLKCSCSKQALRIWSAKEAVSKCAGSGLMTLLPLIGNLPSFEEKGIVEYNNARFTLWQKQFDHDYVLSAAFVTSNDPIVEQFSFTD